MNNNTKKQIGIIVNTLRGDPACILKHIDKILKKYDIEAIIIYYDISSYINIKKATKKESIFDRFKKGFRR